MVKAVYQTRGVASNGELKYYEKPIFMTFLMFLGMAAALPLYYTIIYFQRRNKAAARAAATAARISAGPAPNVSGTVLAKSSSRSYDLSDPFGDNASESSPSSYQSGAASGKKGLGSSKLESILASSPQLPGAGADAKQAGGCELGGDCESAAEDDEDEEDALADWRNLFSLRLNAILLIPSLFDLIGTALSTIGLLYTSVSVYQLSRCTVIIVTAMLKAFVLKHRLSGNMWAGVGINALAMALVGSTAFFAPADAAVSEGSGHYTDARCVIIT